MSGTASQETGWRAGEWFPWLLEPVLLLMCAALVAGTVQHGHMGSGEGTVKSA